MGRTSNASRVGTHFTHLAPSKAGPYHMGAPNTNDSEGDGHYPAADSMSLVLRRFLYAAADLDRKLRGNMIFKIKVDSGSGRFRQETREQQSITIVTK